MALALEPIQKAHQRTRVSTQKVAVAEIMRGLFKYLEETKRGPDLQVVFFGLTTGGDTVIADAPCVIHALVYDKPDASTTLASLVGSNHATTVQAAPQYIWTLSASVKATKPIILTFPDGLPFSTGLVIESRVGAASGDAVSAAPELGNGFVIIGAP